MNWDHLCTFEAVARLGSLTAAARALRISQSTVSRHLASLEEIAGAPLVLRTTPARLTDRGASLLVAVAPMVAAALIARSALDDTPQPRGSVTLATVGEVLRWVLTDALPEFYERYPHVQLRILADNRTSSLAAGEADVALRLARPQRGELVARRIHRATYGYFAGADLPLGCDVPWLGLAGSLAAVPQQRHAERVFQRTARLLVEDVEALGRAVEAGLGVAILPTLLVRRLRGIVPVAAESIGAAPGVIPQRDFWVVVHRSKWRTPKVRAVLDWLAGIRTFHFGSSGSSGVASTL